MLFKYYYMFWLQLDLCLESYLITSADEVDGGYVFGPVCLSVCLSVCLFVCLCVAGKNVCYHITPTYVGVHV